MPVSLVQWRGKTGVFYDKFQVFFNSPISCSIVAPSYASICGKVCFTKLQNFILISFLGGILLSYLKNINYSVLMIKHKFDIICLSETLKVHLISAIWKQLVTKLLETITHLTLNVGEFVFITKTHYLLK